VSFDELEIADSTRLFLLLFAHFSFMDKINTKVTLFDELLHTHGERAKYLSLALCSS